MFQVGDSVQIGSGMAIGKIVELIRDDKCKILIEELNLNIEAFLRDIKKVEV